MAVGAFEKVSEGTEASDALGEEDVEGFEALAD